MAINADILLKSRSSDRNLYLVAAIGFPLFVLIGYFKSYYFSNFFADARPIANALVHIHGIVMSLWVLYFIAQVLLIRSKKVKLHMTLGFIGIGLAALVVVSGFATAYDFSFIRQVSPGGMHPHSFFIFPAGDMLMFIVFFAGAVYFRKRPAEHKTLMLMTAINFLPAAFSRMPIFPEATAFEWAFGVTNLLAASSFMFYTAKHRRFNRVFFAAVALLIALNTSRFAIADSEMWLNFTALLAP